ncbi:glycoside hydrolase family 97 catalytic domain-containing protein [Paenibacillus sp. GCM10023252]|uniref:glycoside hydrolase family 97 protein n=1 Tax=Paenibacillus sp. GCM10023252 TaxID=3252649 RepID=UPI00360C6E22
MNSHTAASPNGLCQAACYTKDGTLYYTIQFGSQMVIQESRLSLELAGHGEMLSNLQLTHVDRSAQERAWEPLYGERSVVRDHYQAMILEYVGSGRKRVKLEFRAYNEGVAFRYIIPEQPELEQVTVVSEGTEFNCPIHTIAYHHGWPEDDYHPMRISQMTEPSERPLALQMSGPIYASLLEAGMNHYAKMKLVRAAEGSSILRSLLSSPVQGKTPFYSPWRVIILGERPGDLLENNDIMLNLNEECALSDTSWIKPGKAIREITLSTAGGKRCIDFAAKHNLQYILYDAGWYGHEYDEEADASFVSPDWDRIKDLLDYDGLDLHEVIAYGKERGIGVFLYVNRRALERQLDEILPLYEAWGVSGIKFGFVNEGPQEWTVWLLEAVRKCAKHKLMVDIHDYYRPTGYSRTYPNLLTQEGIRGNEYFPTARHNTMLPFTRYPAGAGDYTICCYDSRVHTSRAHQMAMSIIAYSPLQLLFWYDRPELVQDGPDMELFERLSTVWDDTKVIDGLIGEFAVLARRKGDEWFVGAITNENARLTVIPTYFLDPDKRYELIMFSDDGKESLHTIEVSRTVIEQGKGIQACMAPSGGFAAMLRPIRD